MVTSILATQLLQRQEDALILRAGERLAAETAEEREETVEELGGGLDDEQALQLSRRPGATRGSDEVLDLALYDELEDVELPRPRARIDHAGRMLAGDAAVVRLPVGECVGYRVREGPARACAVDFEDGTLVLSVSTSLTEARPSILGWSAVVGLFVSALFGGVASRVLTAWGLRPLSSLRERMRKISADTPSPELLEPPLEHAEIEYVRQGLADLVDRLGRALDDSRRFSSRVAHELRTPLTTIRGELELLLERASPADHAGLERVRAQVSALGTLVERLLILADRTRLDVGETVDLADVVEEVVGRLSVIHRARVRLELAEDVLVRGDGTLLQVLLSNALENALKFSDSEVWVRVGHHDGALLAVEDSGPGIGEHELATVRRHLGRGRHALREKLPGHGVGLALIEHIADIHGGRMTIETLNPYGTRVTVRLPRWRPTSRSLPTGSDA